MILLVLFEFLVVVVVAIMATMAVIMRTVVKRVRMSFLLLLLLLPPEFEILARNCFILFMIGLEKKRWKVERQCVVKKGRGRTIIYIVGFRIISTIVE